MIPQEIAKLNPAERLELVEDIWDSLTDLPEAVPVTAAQKAELGRRLARYRSDPHGGMPWSEVKSRILGRE
jgi:putative addiction module component (TIGR02574 family)